MDSFSLNRKRKTASQVINKKASLRKKQQKPIAGNQSLHNPSQAAPTEAADIAKPYEFVSSVVRVLLGRIAMSP